MMIAPKVLKVNRNLSDTTFQSSGGAALIEMMTPIGYITKSEGQQRHVCIQRMARPRPCRDGVTPKKQKLAVRDSYSCEASSSIKSPGNRRIKEKYPIFAAYKNKNH